MRTLLKIAVVAIAFWLYCVVAARSSTLEDTIQASSVYVESYNGECSGTVVDSRFTHVLILTAKHCVLNKISAIRINEGKHTYSSIGKITKSTTQDLAIIELLDSGPQHAARIASNPLVRGDAFTLIGLSFNVPWALSRGFVMAGPSGIEYEKVHYKDIPLACSGCDTGDSGSGVFNDRGELAGVFVAGSLDNVRTYMVPLKDVLEFLKGAGL